MKEKKYFRSIKEYEQYQKEQAKAKPVKKEGKK